MVKLEDWLGTIPSPMTRKSYRHGIKQFERFLNADIETVMSKDDTELGHILEKFYVWLKNEGKTQNTARSTFNCPLQYMKYFGKNPRYRKALGIFRTTMSTRDHKLTIGEVQEIAKVSDLREQTLLEVFLLGLRISDVSTLEWKPFEEDEFLLNTRKENVVAHIFVSAEFREILNRYLKTIDPKNKYLFQSVKNEHLTTKHIDYMLHALVKRAGLPNNIHWHLGRKLVFRTGLELGIPNPNMKLMLGKSVPMSDSTYYEQGINLKPDADKLHNVIRLFAKPQVVNGEARKLLDTVFQVLRSLVEDKLKEQGMLKKTKPIDWNEIYQRLLPEEERKERVQID
jgi:site-specific recombinase XerD